MASYNTELPHISVIIPSYDITELNNLKDSIDSVLHQEYDNFDIVVITEGEELTEKVENKYSRTDSIEIIQIENEDGGISYARNKGIEYSEGEIIAYIDSDATAEDNWLYNMGKLYSENNEIIAVGGNAIPNWVGNRPKYLPDEFLWLVGVTHSNHPEDGEIIRSSFGCNMSYRRNIFDNIDGFNVELGKNHGFNLQGEEPELGSRIIKEYNTGMYYSEDITVLHTVEPYQCTIKWLSKRAYLQGRTKSIMKNNSAETELDTEENYLKSLYLKSIPNYIKSSSNIEKMGNAIYSIFGIIYFTILVAMGYIREEMSTLIGY